MGAVSAANVDTLFVLLAFVAFALAVWRGWMRDVVGAVLLAFIGIVILIVTVA